MIDLVFKNHTLTVAPGKEFFKKIIEHGTRIIELKGKLEISVNLVSEAKIKELNRKYRRKNKPTDVLSFPLRLAPLAQGKLRGAKGIEVPLDYAQGKSNVGALDLGDIFICLSIAKKEAKRDNISIETKLAQLTVHGFLHLLGYDHPDDKMSGPRLKRRGERMFALEDKILNKL